MMKSFKVMLVPNNRQRMRLFQFAGAARFAYNWALNREMTAYKAGETKQAIKDCVDAYRKFFKKQSGSPKFKSKKRGDFNFYQDTDKIRITSTHVKFESIATSRRKNRRGLNVIRLAERDRIPVGVKYFQPRISFDGLNRWLSVAIEFEPENHSEPEGEPIGIDLGIKNLATCSDGTIYPNINRTETVRKLKKTKRRLQRSISRKYEMNKKKGERYRKTSNIIKSERKLLRIHHRLANIRQNRRHQITSEIIGRKPRLIVLENLNVRGMMSNRHLSNAVREQGFFDFRRQIEYKAAWNGVRVVIAGRYYPSSKTCVVCGHVKKDLQLSERVYRCLAGNLSLWSVEKTRVATAKTDALNQEWNIKVNRFL